MKNQKHVSNIKLNLVGPANASLPSSGTLFARVVGEFLAAKGPKCRPAYLHTLYYVLRRLVQDIGSRPISAVTTHQLQQVLFGPRFSPCSRKHKLAVIRTFFSWCRAHGYLPAQTPTAVDLAYVNVPQFDLTVLTPAELKTLLAGAKDVEALLRIVIPVFAGIRRSELKRLSWKNIIPGARIFVDSSLCMNGVDRVIPMLAVLDAWLRPFYGSQGMVLRPGALRLRLRASACDPQAALRANCLRHTYLAYRFGQTRSLAMTAMEAGLNPSLLHKHFHLPVTKAQIKEYFSLTPAAVGINDWAKIVAKYLAQPLEERPKPGC